ncbi:MAG TPA: ParB/RepB/Spo0J family partition protein, partial [Clostridia bacterium]|nr:ParB/RepB/Spo0J family partition protein [Clostridia bacterium]
MPVFDFLKDNPAADKSRQLVELPVAKIRPNPYQPRTAFDEESIAELAQSIRQVGLLQPLLVRRVGDVYELVAGERRLRAVTSL